MTNDTNDTTAPTRASAGIDAPNSDTGVKTYELVKRKPKDFIASHENHTVGALLDELRDARDAETLAKGQAGLLKTMLYARHNPPLQGIAEEHGTVISSENNSATITFVQQSRFDQEAFANDYPDLFKQYQKTTSFTQLKYAKD